MKISIIAAYLALASVAMALPAGNDNNHSQ
jgi:hypothetical protein